MWREENKMMSCTYCARRKPTKGMARIEFTGDFIKDRPLNICSSCFDQVIHNLDSLPWNPTYTITWPYYKGES